MNTIDDFQALHDQGNYEECIENVNIFLLFNPQNIEALLLKAKCEYRQADSCEDDQDAKLALYGSAYHSFEVILNIRPTEEEAMLFAAYINIYFTKVNLPEAKVYCDILALSDDENRKLAAINYRQRVHFLMDNIELSLEDIDTQIKLNQTLYQHNRSALDREVSFLYLEKVNLYLWNRIDPVKVFETFNDGIVYPHNDALTYGHIANLALDHEELEVAGKAALLAFLNCDNEPHYELSDLYHRISRLNRIGQLNKSLVHSMLLALQKFPESLGTDITETISIASHYSIVYPDWDVPLSFAGVFLFDEGSYEKALVYLEKSLELGGMAQGLQRYIEASYRVNGKLPVIEKWPQDSAIAYYNAGCDISNQTLVNIWNESIGLDLARIMAKFYEISYQIFHDYFYNNLGESMVNHVHTFAKCCNNYGIVLDELREHEKAVEVHQLGYSLSPFWEQLIGWGMALKNMGRFEESIEIFKVADSYEIDYMSFPRALRIRGGVLDMTCKLGLKDEARVLLNKITIDYDEFLEVNRAKLTKQELFELSEEYIVVQNIRYDLLREESSVDVVKIWHEELVKNPDDNSAWFMLMQEYFQLKDYSQCIACADNYQAVKKDAIQIESHCKIHFMRGMSHLTLGNYTNAINNFESLIESLKKLYGGDDSELCIVYRHSVHCCYMLKQWDKCISYALQHVAYYKKNKWMWDHELVEVSLHYADACYAIGSEKEARGALRNILKFFPDNEDAQRRKQEWRVKGGLFYFLHVISSVYYSFFHKGSKR
ncbi:hypothetical protein H7F33_06440 [Pedobacter sp. PAMC26386]|nr:hypothetical protein H7F33_06440 [Pedobacter sp. PAMC26386]